MTHHLATVRGGQIVVRGLDVPDGTRVSITVIESESEGWPARGQDPSLISLEEANAHLAPFRMKVVPATAKDTRKAGRRGARALRELIVPPDIAEGLDQAFREMDRGELVSREESDADIARLRAEWVSREQGEVRSLADTHGTARSKRRGKLVAGQSRAARAKSPGEGARTRVRAARSKP